MKPGLTKVRVKSQAINLPRHPRRADLKSRHERKCRSFPVLPRNMIFFTRELYNGYQPKSGWERKAITKTNRNSKLYQKYFRLIRPFLPASAIKLSSFNFHDSELLVWRCRGGKLEVVLDTFGTFVPLPARYAHLTFLGVSQCPSEIPRKKEWWLFDEFHLGSQSRFCLHLMFTETDVQIAADAVRVRFKNEVCEI